MPGVALTTRPFNRLRVHRIFIPPLPSMYCASRPFRGSIRALTPARCGRKEMNRLKRAVWIGLCLALTLTTTSVGQNKPYKITVYDASAASLQNGGSAHEAINSKGDIVGLYFDSNGAGHGYLLNGGFAAVDFPGAVNSAP